MTEEHQRDTSERGGHGVRPPQPKEAPKYRMKKCEENYRQMRDGGRAAGFHGLPGGFGEGSGGATGYRRLSARPLCSNRPPTDLNTQSQILHSSVQKESYVDVSREARL